MKKMTIITSKESWYFSYAKALQAKIKAQGHICDLIFNMNAISSGDICFILSYDKLISSDDLKKNEYNVVCHASDLPQGKGWSPMTWQVLEGADRIPVTMFEADENVDSGLIYKKIFFDLDGCELIDDLRDKLANNIELMVLGFCNNQSYYTRNASCQVGKESFYKRRRPEDSMVDTSSTIEDIFRLLRVSDNDRYPVYFMKNGTKYILKCEKDER